MAIPSKEIIIPQRHVSLGDFTCARALHLHRDVVTAAGRDHGQGLADRPVRLLGELVAIAAGGTGDQDLLTLLAHPAVLVMLAPLPGVTEIGHDAIVPELAVADVEPPPPMAGTALADLEAGGLVGENQLV